MGHNETLISIRRNRLINQLGTAGNFRREYFMKFELKLLKTEKGEEMINMDGEKSSGNFSKDETTIDIVQVFAAQQTLLKNMCRKMETLEKKLSFLEASAKELHNEQTLLEKVRQKLLTAPAKLIKPWRSEVPHLDKAYFSKFSLFDRFFNPEKMRRKTMGVDC